MPDSAQNEIKFMEMLAQVDPELYRIKVALEATRVNPLIIVPFIKAIANMAYGTGFGKVQVFMQERVVTEIKPEESVLIRVQALEEIDNPKVII